MADHDMSAIPRWPTKPPTAATLMAYCIGRAQRAYVLRERYVTSDPDMHMALIVEMIAEHDRYLLLDRLRRHTDLAVADAAARDLWTAAEAGDSYGEWIYDWCRAEGLDPDAIREQFRAAIRGEDTDG